MNIDMTTEKLKNFGTRLHAFVEAAQQVHNTHRDGGNGSSLKPGTMMIERGPRYVRVFESTSWDERFVFCFVDTTNGDILKPKGWAGPDQKSKTRRSIFGGDLLLAALDMHRAIDAHERLRICEALGLPE
jgi:hypothetical protein